MIEKHIVLEEIDPALFYGVNNTNLQMIKALFPNTYGMPIVEAMACEKPVITLDDAAITKDVKDKTFVCSENDLATVLRDRTYKCDIKSNVEFYNEHSVEKRAEQFLNIYKEI